MVSIDQCHTRTSFFRCIPSGLRQDNDFKVLTQPRDPSPCMKMVLDTTASPQQFNFSVRIRAGITSGLVIPHALFQI